MSALPVPPPSWYSLFQNKEESSATIESELIATVVVLIPSHYTCEAVHFSRDGVLVEQDSSTIDPGSTSVFAWLPAVEHESEPITSGHALALTYHVTQAKSTHSRTSSSPSLSQDTFAISELNRIFRSWNSMENSSDGLCKLVYLLDGAYTSDNLALSVLSGEDAQRASALDMLAGTHGLALGFVSVHCCTSGDAVSDEGLSNELEFERLVDAHSGEELAPALEVAAAERIPRDFADAVRNGRRAGEQQDEDEDAIRAAALESYVAWASGTRESTSPPPDRNRTALVVWSRRNHLDVLYGGRAGIERAWAAIEAMVEEPTAQDRALVDFVLARASGEEDTAETCCQAALRWRDLNTWCRVVEVCAASLGLAGVDDETKLRAVEVFGFETIRGTFETMLNAEKHNSTRMAFLQRVDDWLGEPHAATKGRVRDVRRWLKQQRQKALISLRPPSLDEAALLLDAARENGGLSYLREQMLPQLKVCASGEFVLHFAHALHQATSWKQRGKKEALRDILGAGFSAMFARPASDAAERIDAASFALCKDYVETCTRFGHGDLVDDLMKHMAAAAALPGLSIHKGGEFARRVLVPFVNYLAQRTQTGQPTRRSSQFDVLRRSAVDLWRKWVEVSQEQFTEDEIWELIEAAIPSDGNLDVLVSVLAPAVKALKLPGHNFRHLVDALWEFEEPLLYPKDYSGPSFDQIIVSLARRYAQDVPLGDADAITDAVEWVISVDPLLAPAIFDRVLAKSELTASYVKGVLMPVARKLCKEANEEKRRSTLAPLLQGIVAAWVSTIPPSSDQDFLDGWGAVKRWKCQCVRCAEVCTFLADSSLRSKRLWNIGAAKVKHVSRGLSLHAFRLASWETDGTKSRGLKIHKSEGLLRYQFWDREQKDAEEMLRDISDNDAVLQEIIGVQYARMKTALEQGADIDRGIPFSTAKRGTEESYRATKRRRYRY
ncbi:hypothetical protein PsYK624_034480 [Phanerochaete sordida]|uniref:Uncharacterized protein n=1 Tax=Phanerochaete sordida TaxID=48140 RepID=A0A9P3G3T8_9APHY|nr:hypothetical protein PsYK624_034480 [Phanerochaete sordida]